MTSPRIFLGRPAEADALSDGILAGEILAGQRFVDHGDQQAARLAIMIVQHAAVEKRRTNRAEVCCDLVARHPSLHTNLQNVDRLCKGVFLRQGIILNHSR